MRKNVRKMLGIWASRLLSLRVLVGLPIAAVAATFFLFGTSSLPLAAALRDPLAVLSERSPGQRDNGALYNTKAHRKSLALAGPTKPTERVLAAIHERPAPTGLFPPADQNLLPLLANSPLIGDSPLISDNHSPVDGGLLPANFLGGGTPSNFAGSSPSSATPGILPASQTPLATSELNVSSSVPEPATWVLNIVGLFMMGAMCRRRRIEQSNAESVKIPTT